MAGGLPVNVVANLVGRAWPVVLSLLAVPLYLGYLGVEAYALVTLFITLQSVCAVLDMGMGATLTRELARARASGTGPVTAAAARDLVRSLEVPYWSIAALLAAASFLVGGPIGERWFHPEALSVATVGHSTMLMGLAVAAQLPFILYSGGLAGLERQVLLNGVTAVVATVRVVGTLLVLDSVSATIETFFVCQVAAAALQTVAGAVALWVSMPRAQRRSRFDGALLRSKLAFAAGVAGTTLAGLALTHSDKAVLSSALPLHEFGYYGLAAALAGGVTMIAVSVFGAVFPRLSHVVGHGGDESGAYHRSAQILAVLVLPAAVAVGWLSHDMLLAWTGRADVAENAALPATLLVAGSALNGLMHVPYALMLAHGWTRLPLVTNLVAVLVLVPAVAVAVHVWGMVGAASIWVALNAGYVCVSVPILHSRHLRGEASRWYLHDVLLPCVGAVAGAAAAGFLIPDPAGRTGTLLRIAAVGFASMLGAVSLAGELRRFLLSRLRPARGGASRPT